MAHNTFNIANHHSGDSMQLEITVEDRDLTGSVFRYQFSESPDGEELTGYRSNIDDNASIDETNDVITVELEPADTEGITGKYYHEGTLIGADGWTETLFTGEVEVKPSINPPEPSGEN